MSKEDMTPGETKLIKELKKIEINKKKKHEQILDEFLWGAASLGSYEGVLKRR
jgi:hypothetical protein